MSDSPVLSAPPPPTTQPLPASPTAAGSASGATKKRPFSGDSPVVAKRPPTSTSSAAREDTPAERLAKQKLSDELVALIGREAKGMTSRALVKATGKPTKEVNPRLKDLEHIGTVVKEKMTYHLANNAPHHAAPQRNDDAPPPPPPPPPAEPTKVSAAALAPPQPSNGIAADVSVEPHPVGPSSS